MATPNQKLAESLVILRDLQKEGRRVFQSSDFTRTHRERLIEHGFLKEAIKGWLISSAPDVRDGDSTPWYASFWEFCGRYCRERFGEEWHLSPEQSLMLHAENTVIPKQVVVYTPKGTNHGIDLAFGTSIYDLKQAAMPNESDILIRDGLRLFSASAALLKVSDSFMQRFPIETQVVLASIRDADDVLRSLLSGGHSVIAGRLAGAFRRIGRADVADEILKTMTSAGYDVRESNPFARQQTFASLRTGTPPIVGRLQSMWQSMRGTVLQSFPNAPGLPKTARDKNAYLKFVDDIYKSDAYHSLSIEGYTVSAELIEKVKRGDWNPDPYAEDRQNRDALAARGYWEAFQEVKETVARIITGENPGTLLRTAHRDWYRALFQPCVAAGLLQPGALAGYRNDAVYLRTSRYVPPRWEAVRDAMPALFDMLEQETEPAVRAALGHWMFGYIHPYPDGNGRMARFLMNAMLASGGYPWTVIRVEDRTPYLKALDSASIDGDIRPFASFVAERVKWSLEQTG